MRKRRRRGPDRGTPEQQLRKAVLAGGGAPRLTEYPLGCLLARRPIRDDQHNAGLHYAGLYRACIGGGLRQPGGPREISEEAELAVHQRFDESQSALKNCGKTIKNRIDDICVFEKSPTWLTAAIAGGEKQKLHIQIGLQALADWKEKGKK